MNKDCLSLFDFDGASLILLLQRARRLKYGRKNYSRKLEGKVLALIFEKESTRTRVSFEAAMARLGGRSIYIGRDASQLSRGESYSDTAKVLSRYIDGLVLRTFSQTSLEELAHAATIPVINGLTDLFHPCQVLADLMTIQEKKGTLEGIKIAYIGDGNNMANTWIQAAMILKLDLRLGCPKGFWPPKNLLKDAADFPKIRITTNAREAVDEADVLNTDTWFSMGQKVEASKRKAFKLFQLNQKLLNLAAPDALVLHCLPAHRGEEITEEVLDGPQSAVFDQAENRMYVQMALLEKLIK